MVEGVGNNNKILTPLFSEVDSCCSEIKSLLTDLLSLIADTTRKLRDLIIANFTDIESKLENFYKDLTQALIDNTRSLTEQLSHNLRIIEQDLVDLNKNVKYDLTSASADIKDLTSASFTDLRRYLEGKILDFSQKVGDTLEALKRFINTSFEYQLEKIETALSLQSETLLSGIDSYYTLTLLPFLSGISIAVGEVVTSTAGIGVELNKISVTLRSLPETIKHFIDGGFEDLKKYLDDWKKDLVSEIALEVSLQVVGESYYKWDSTSTYFPTITFLFRELDTEQYPRRSQIKVRLSKKNEEVVHSDIDKLKERCISFSNLGYNYGTKRFNYISTDRRFKTTVFGESSEEINDLFTTLLSVIDEPFNDKNLSITEGRLRSNVTKRTKSLGNGALNRIRYIDNFKVTLKKAVLHINGLQSPIILSKS